MPKLKFILPLVISALCQANETQPAQTSDKMPAQQAKMNDKMPTQTLFQAAQTAQTTSNIASTHQLSPIYITADKNELYATSDKDFSGKDKVLNSGDLAKSLLGVAGFSMARKGGGGGSEILFRSQGASRVPTFLNGGMISGGCGGRMDSGTTYIFPENYDKITILKGPQDVRYSALIAGGVLFDRDILRLNELRAKADASLLYGSFSQIEANANAQAGGKFGSLQIFASRYQADDYKTPAKEVVHSASKKESLSLVATLTPFESSAFEFDVDLSRGFAAYADRAMDARTFDRHSFNFRFKQNFAQNSLDLRAWHNEIDHIMDNYSHRPNSGTFSLSNPKRTNTGLRAEFALSVTDFDLIFGGDFNKDKHSSRSASGGASAANNNELAFGKPYSANYLAQIFGAFAQGTLWLDDNALFFGARLDGAKKRLYESKWRKFERLPSGFLRFESYFKNLSLYAGAGLASRGADFWELNKTNGTNLKPEQNAQLDLGAVYKDENFYANASLFASKISDYIIIDWSNSSAFQTSAALLGGEFEGKFSFFEFYNVSASLSYTYGQDLKARTPLPSIAPLQGTLALFYESKSLLLRYEITAHAAQNRYATNLGNIISKDMGRTAGFYTMSLYGGYKSKHFSVFAGVENLTNTLYAYHLSKNSIEIAGLDNPVSNKIYEPGRSFWVKIKVGL